MSVSLPYCHLPSQTVMLQQESVCSSSENPFGSGTLGGTREPLCLLLLLQPSIRFCSTGCKRLGRMMFAPASKDQRSRDISRECQEAAAFPELCCRGSWGLASSDVESFQCCSETGKEHLSETQDRANVSCTVLSAHVVVLSVPGSSPCSVTDVLQLFLASHPSVGTVPSPPLCGQPTAWGKDMDWPVTGR